MSNKKRYMKNVYSMEYMERNNVDNYGINGNMGNTNDEHNMYKYNIENETDSTSK